jgi:hypothetical protein
MAERRDHDNDGPAPRRATSDRPAGESSPVGDALLDLQRAAGNRAVADALAAGAGSGSPGLRLRGAVRAARPPTAELGFGLQRDVKAGEEAKVPSPVLGAGGGVAKGGLLRRGNQGPGVAKVQAALGIAPDGIFGGGTEAAVKAFQADHGLTPDGLVGPMTKGALGGGSGEVATTGNVPAGGTGAVGGAGGSGGVKGSGGGASGEFAFGGATGGDSTVKGVPIDGIEPAPGAEDEKLA